MSHMTSKTSSTKSNAVVPSLGTWALSFFQTDSSTAKSLSAGHSRNFTLIAATGAYILGVLIPVAVLALVVACCALCLSAVVLYWYQEKQQKKGYNPVEEDNGNKPKETKPFAYEASNHRGPEPTAAYPMHRVNSGQINAHNTHIINFSQEDNLEQAHRCLLNMRAQGHAPKLVAYSCFLNACAKSGQVKLAEQCLSYMQEDGVELNNVCYCTIINVYATAGDVDKAEQVFKAMQAAGGEVVPNTAAYNALIKACSRCQQIQRAEGWLARMKEACIEANVITYTTLINACAKSRDAERAEKWLGEMFVHGVEANLMTYNTVIDACAKVGDIARAESCFQRMKKEGITPDLITYNSIINACGQAGNVDCADKWLEEMIKEGLQPCNVSFSICIGACMKAGDIATANRWLTKMFSFGVELSTVNYNTLIHSGIKAQHFDFAERILHHLHEKKKKTEPITYRALIHALAKANQPKRAEEWFTQMRKAHGKEMINSDDLFGPVISAFSNNQNAEAVIHWLEIMKMWDIQISQSLYSKSIKVLQRMGKTQLVRMYTQEMNSYYKSSTAYKSHVSQDQMH